MPWVWDDGLQPCHDDFTSRCSFASSDVSSCDDVPLASSAFRFGEADNPGPMDSYDDEEGMPPLASSREDRMFQCLRPTWQRKYGPATW